MTRERRWSRGDKIALIGTVIAIVGIVVALIVPEIRHRIGLDPSPSPTPIGVDCHHAISDTFNGTLDSNWQWIDPRGDANNTLTAMPGFLRISTPSERDLWHGRNYDAPRLVQPITGNFIAEVKVNFQPSDRTNYQAAGLLLWQDEKNFLRFEIGDRTDRAIPDRIEFSDSHDGIIGFATLPTLPVTLRIERKENTFIASWKGTDGVWQEIGKVDADFNNLLIGLTMINATDTMDYGDFSQFTVSCN